MNKCIRQNSSSFYVFFSFQKLGRSWWQSTGGFGAGCVLWSGLSRGSCWLQVLHCRVHPRAITHHLTSSYSCQEVMCHISGQQKLPAQGCSVDVAQQFSSKAQTLTWWSLWQLLISLVIPTGCSQLALALWEIQQSHFLPSWFLAKPRAAYENLLPQCSRRDSSKRFHSELSEAGGNHVSVTLRLSRGYYMSWGLLVGHGGYLYAIALSEVKKYSAPHGVCLDSQWLATRLARTDR